MNGMRRLVANKKMRSKPIEKPDLTFWYETAFDGFKETVFKRSAAP